MILTSGISPHFCCPLGFAPWVKWLINALIVAWALLHPIFLRFVIIAALGCYDAPIGNPSQSSQYPSSWLHVLVTCPTQPLLEYSHLLAESALLFQARSSWLQPESTISPGALVPLDTEIESKGVYAAGRESVFFLVSWWTKLAPASKSTVLLPVCVSRPSQQDPSSITPQSPTCSVLWYTEHHFRMVYLHNKANKSEGTFVILPMPQPYTLQTGRN